MPTAVVTGAASGMGHATAEMYLARGWRVLGVDITPDLGIRHDGLTSLAVGCLLLAPPALAVKPGGTLYIKSKDTKVLEKADAKA